MASAASTPHCVSRPGRWLPSTRGHPSKDQAQQLIAALPEHLADLKIFSLSTGLRSANAARITWPQIDLERQFAWIYPDQAKARRAIPVPLNSAAFAVVMKQIGKHPERVFTYDGKPIERGSTSAWYRAIKRVGLQNFRYHDLRHVWASWHVQSGTPLFALQELAGWETERMVRRYAHLSGEHLAPHAERMAEHLGTFWEHRETTTKSRPTRRSHDVVSTAKIWWPRAELNHRHTDFQSDSR
jgi:integrase